MLQSILQPLCKKNFYTVAEVINFGEWLREHRKKAGLTQSDVAKRAGLSFSYVSTIERAQPHTITGSNILPTRETVEALAKAVNGDVGEALALCGYALNREQPKNIKEFLEALDRLVPGYNFAEEYKEAGTLEDLNRLMTDIKLIIFLAAKRNREGETRRVEYIEDAEFTTLDEVVSQHERKRMKK